MKTRNMSWKRKGFILAFLAPTVIAFVLFYLYPIVTVFLGSSSEFYYMGTSGSVCADTCFCFDRSCIFP